MARVTLGSECWPFTGGQSDFDIEAATVRDVIAALDARFPGLGAFVDKRMAFAIDGAIHQPVAATYSLAEIQEALRPGQHELAPGRALLFFTCLNAPRKQMPPEIATIQASHKP